MRVRAAVVVLATTALLAAQGAPPPAKELQQLQPLVGSWEGAGTAVMAPGAPPTPWKAQSVYAWQLGGHWLQCDTAVRFEGLPTALRFRDYLGWDGERKRLVVLAVGNGGDCGVHTLHVLADGGLLLQKARVWQGQPLYEREVIRFGKDQYALTTSAVHGDGPLQETVRGTMQKVAATTPPALEAAGAVDPLPPAMARMVRMVGEYDVKGDMVMEPGQAAVQVTGRDSVRSLFGGAVVQVVSTGAATAAMPAYEAHGFYGWDAEANCYVAVSVDNMGMVMDMRGHLLTDGRFVLTTAGLRAGQPVAVRLVMDLDQDGRPVRIAGHSSCGAAPPFEDFRGTYTRVTK